MSKFKVGDKVRVTYGWAFGTVGTIKRYVDSVRFVMKANEEPNHAHYKDEDDIWCFHSADDLVELVIDHPRREFIVIRRSGAETIAELRHNREVIKSAKATCAPSDTFDLDTGAKLAFDRLMGRDEKPITGKSFDRIFVDDIAPQPAHRFKVGDRVVVDGTYGGEISAISKLKDDDEPYLVYCPKTGFHSGNVGEAVCKPEHANKCNWASENRLSPAPAPEPPKFYTGKVVCVSGEYGIGAIYVVENGYFVATGMNCPGKPYKSVDEMNHRFLFGTFAEVKEPSDV